MHSGRLEKFGLERFVQDEWMPRYGGLITEADVDPQVIYHKIVLTLFDGDTIELRLPMEDIVTGYEQLIEMLDKQLNEELVKIIRGIVKEKKENQGGIVPDLIDYVVGYRAWRVSSKAELLPIGAGDHIWKGNEVIRAKCRYQESLISRVDSISELIQELHEPPDEHCECGLYFRHLPDGLHERMAGGVWGVCLCWGKMCVHSEGFRSEYAQPLALANEENRFGKDVETDLVKTIAKINKLDLVAADEIHNYALEFGRAIPPELYPGKEER